MCHLQEFHSEAKQDKSAPFGGVFMAGAGVIDLNCSLSCGFCTSGIQMWDTPRATMKVPAKIYYFKQHKGARLTQGLWLITMATVLMAVLLPRSAGRHHHTKPREDREGWEDRGWRELSLQTVVCNALWEPRWPRTARQGINQAHAWDQETAACRHALPDLPAGDWLACAIIDLRPFSVISRPQEHPGDRYRINSRPQLC